MSNTNNAIGQVSEISMSYPHLVMWMHNVAPDEFNIHNPKHWDMIPKETQDYAAFMAELRDVEPLLMDELAANARTKLSRSTCFAYLKYAKKWMGWKAPDNLAKLSLAELRSLVNVVFPGTKLPVLVHPTYKGLLAILRALRILGHKVKLNTTLPNLLRQVELIIPTWRESYNTLVTESERYHRLVSSLTVNLTSAYYKVKVMTPEEIASPSPLSTAALSRIPPDELVDALQDPIHKDVGRSRPVYAARSAKR